MQMSRIFGFVAFCVMPWAVLGCPSGLLGGFGIILDRLGLILQCQWSASGRLGVHLGVSWWHLVPSWGCFWRSRVVCFDAAVTHLRPSGTLCAALCRLGVSLWIVGRFLGGGRGRGGDILERLRLILQCQWATSGRLGVHLGMSWWHLG